MGICMRGVLIIAVFLFATISNGAEYYVATSGSDAHDGLSRQAAFATVQKGVDALEPGDTLTILPGDYHESVRLDKLGGAEAQTTIRAEIPGTVFLRGDVPAPAFQPVPGRRFVYVADFDFDGEIPAVNELDTLTILRSTPSAAELQFLPGAFHYDRAEGKLYISTSDSRPPFVHAYSVSLIPTHGFYLSNARRVVVEGLSVTGFNALEQLHYRERTHGGVWGIFLADGKECVIRDCRAWLNGWGIGLNSSAATSGDNVIERCAAWGNTSAFKSGDMGGLTGFSVRRDVIRDSVAFLNGNYGVNIYGTGVDGTGTYGDPNRIGNDEANKSRLVNNLAWGNGSADVKIKTGVAYFHTVEGCVGTGLWSIRPENVSNSIIGRSTRDFSGTNINLADYGDLDLDAEFADPANHDYRLQATSRFRGTGPDGADPGPFQHRANVFFAKPDGNDAADGLSVENAWRTLARGVRNLREDDTLYLLPGVYDGDIEVALSGSEGQPISIRGRGRGEAAIQGAVALAGASHVAFQRVSFDGSVAVTGAGGPRTADAGVSFESCRFRNGDVGLAASGVSGLALTHCEFSNFAEAAVSLADCSNVDLRGNWYDNADGVAVRLDDRGAIGYSGLNGCRNEDNAWSLSAPQAEHAARFGTGPFGKPLGPYRDAPAPQAMRLVDGPTVHSVSATTADIEWAASLPATTSLAWGETPECENTAEFDANCFGTYSLTGLRPDTTYYFRIDALRVPQKKADGIEAEPLALAGEPIAFATLARNPSPTTYYVAPDGDDANTGRSRESAWRTIQRAADRAGAGDTVLVAGGTYRERVRVRASGAEGAPVEFRSMPGEKVVMDGVKKALGGAFAATGKSHLRFDGFYFREFNFFPGHVSIWILDLASEFTFYKGRDIRVSRCFSDGRSGYTARFVTAMDVEDLAIENCVVTNKMSGSLLLLRCPRVRLEHSVIARPMIQSYHLWNQPSQPGVVRNNIFTDCLQKKAALNTQLLEFAPHIQNENNCVFLRFPSDVRHVIRNQTIHQLDETLVRNPVVADPQFAGVARLIESGQEPSEFPPEMLMNPSVDIDFDSFFATNPEVAERGIGLQPEAFKDFHFNTAEDD